MLKIGITTLLLLAISVGVAFASSQGNVHAMDNRAFTTGSTATYASDTFTRTITDDWGSAEVGGPWFRGGGSASDYHVNGAEGIHQVGKPGSSRNTWLNINQTDVNVKYKFKTDKLAKGNSLYQLALLRASDAKNYYGARVEFLSDQRVKVVFEKRVSGTRTKIGTRTEVIEEIHAADIWFWVRAQAEGVNPTTLRIKVWQDGTPEQSSWDYQVTDSEASLQSGGVGVRSLTHSKTSDTPIRYAYDDFTATAIPIESGTEPIDPIYVDPVNGSDRNSGSSVSPYLSIQKALEKVQPGWTIKLASGIYQEANETVVSGTASGPITIEPDADATPILDGNSNSLNAIRIVHSYYVLKNLEIRNTKQGVRLEGVEGVVLENNHLHHINNECVRLRYFAINNTISGNTIHDCGLNGNGEGIYLGTAPEQQYKNNDQPDTTMENTITGNEIYNVTEGIDIKEESSSNTISNNTIYNSTDPKSAGINVRADENYLYDNLSYNNQGAGFRFGGDVAYSPTYGDSYNYGVNNVLRNNVANNNVGYGYKFMNGPQDANCTNTGSANKELYYFGSGVDKFLSCETTGSDALPTVSITSPANGSTVSGTATIQVHATDYRDAQRTFDVKVFIDSATPQEATYNSTSGYYELDWDTTSLTGGTQHTIDASATGSDGNTTNAAQITCKCRFKRRPDHLEKSPTLGCCDDELVLHGETT